MFQRKDDYPFCLYTVAEMKDQTLIQRANPELTVADLLNHWEQAASVFVNRRMACVGCPMASFETLDNVAHVYGMSVQALIIDLQQAIGQE